MYYYTSKKIFYIINLITNDQNKLHNRLNENVVVECEYLHVFNMLNKFYNFV